MSKYRKKPVEIEAVQITPDNHDEILAFMEATKCPFEMTGDHEMVIHTLEGDMHLSKNDWLIQGVKGEFYPCKPDIFEATYEPVEVPSGSYLVTDPDEIFKALLDDPAFTEAVHRDADGVYLVGGDGSRKRITQLEMSDGPLEDEA